MSDVLVKYKKVDYPLPVTNRRWAMYGAGFENLGRDGKPVAEPMPDISGDELLARIDAVGLCFSDIKLISQGPEHPRITGRDLMKNPTVPGHEASLTIVKVGKNREKDFKVGERYLIQADVFYKGVSIAFGYVLPGALQQYVVIGKEILDGDEGCYLLPVRENDGYAEVALSEPWACVLASYRITRRETLKPGGTAWFLGTGGARFDEYEIDGVFSPAGAPERVLVSGIKGKLLDKLNSLARTKNIKLIITEGVPSPLTAPADTAGEDLSGKGFDDIVIFGTPSPEMVEKLSAILEKNGIFAILADTPVGRKVKIDVGRIHYDNHHYIGAKGTNLTEAYRLTRTMDLKPGGKVLIVGAGGPMGQMHTQRAAAMKEGPEVIVATDTDSVRLKAVGSRFAHLAEERNARFVTLNPKEMNVAQFEERLKQESGDGFFDDIIIMAPVAALIEQNAKLLGEGGVMNIFAGVPRGTMAMLDISDCYLRGCRWIGSSGSKIADLQYTLEQTQKQELSPNHSVAAIGGLEAALEGLKAVKEGRFPGKIVIWPQLPALPLLSLEELGKHLPQVAAKLTAKGMWTKEAEEELLRTQLKLES